MVEYCTEEEKCLHNLLLHYFSDRSGLPSGRCGGKCSNCMRALGLPGAPPTRAELAAATTERRKKAPGQHQGFVKASTLLGSGAQPSRKGASSEGAGKGAAAAKRSRAGITNGGKGKGRVSHQQAGSGAPHGAHMSMGGPLGGVQQTRPDTSDQGRGALLAARAKKMQAASLAAAGQHRIAQIQQKQAVQVRGATKALSEDEEHLHAY